MRSSRVMASFAFVGLVLASVACNRVASQKNFLGAACRDQSECPSDLTCRDGFCRAFCSPGAKCPNAGEQCINGACVPPQSSGPEGTIGDDGGVGLPNTEPGGGRDSGTGPIGPTNAPGNGTPVRTDIASDSPDFTFAVDEAASKLFYAAEEMDQFSGMKTFLYEAGFDKSPPTKVLELSGPQASRGNLHVAGGFVYWVEPGALYRVPVGGNTKAKVADLGGGIGPDSWNAPGGKFVFQDNQQRVRVYDMNTGTLDSTIYETLSADDAQGGAVFGTTIFWSVLEKSTSNQTVFRKGTLGSSASTKPFTLSAGVIGVTTFVATSQAVAFYAGNPTALASLDSAHPGPTPHVLLNNVNVGAAKAPTMDGVFAYVPQQKAGGGATPIMKVNVEDGTSSEVGKYGEDTPQTRVVVSGANVYWYETTHVGGGMTISVVSRPK